MNNNLVKIGDGREVKVFPGVTIRKISREDMRKRELPSFYKHEVSPAFIPDADDHSLLLAVLGSFP